MELLVVVSLAEFLIRAVASRRHLPGKDRYELLRIANMLAALLTRAQFR